MPKISLAALLIFSSVNALTAKVLPDVPGAVPIAADANDNRKAAGKLSNGVLTVHLEAHETMFYPEGISAPGISVFAFAEMGKNASVPGPLIRVSAGTEVRAIIHNRLQKQIRMRGLEDRSVAALDTFDIAPGATRELTFRANVPGTFYYWGRTAGDLANRGFTEDSQLMGALIVDPAGMKMNPRERIMVMTLFEDTVRTLPKPDEKEVFAINGLSWPHTERLSYAVGDTVKWRVINFTVAQHPMHLHGFYFDVASKGNATRDTLFTDRMKRKTVTEPMLAGTTMSMSWVPTRPGNWLFHCHLIFHIDAALKLMAPHPGPHAPAANHAEDGMSGLVMGIRIAPKSGTGIPAEPVAARKLRMYVNERANVYGNKPGFAFVLQDGAVPPTADSLTLPSSTVVLYKGEPTEITVINHTKQMTGVHWHGIELNSYYDGVGDWSGWQKKTAPVIAPNDSFIVKLTPDRSGTFIYHTHVDETVQLTSGLYGPLLVLDKGTSRDTAERLFLMGDGGPPASGAPPFINGSRETRDVSLSANTRYRFRLINISAGATKLVRLLSDSTVVAWRPIAKDGATLPSIQATSRPGVFALMPGETYDVEILESKPRSLILEVTVLRRAGQVVTRIPVNIK